MFFYMHTDCDALPCCIICIPHVFGRAFCEFVAAGSMGKTGNMMLLMQLVSCDYDSQARKKYAAARRQELTGSWRWVASPFSRAVRTLIPSQAVAAQIGKGGRSLGFVN